MHRVEAGCHNDHEQPEGGSDPFFLVVVLDFPVKLSKSNTRSQKDQVDDVVRHDQSAREASAAEIYYQNNRNSEAR